MINEFIVVLKDSRYIPITTESNQPLMEDEKMNFVDYISDVESVKNNSSLERVVWVKNKFIIFLKDERFIKIEVESLNAMTLEEKMEYAVEHLKMTGVNVDKISHIGDENELQSKTNATLFAWGITAILIIVAFIFIF